MTTQVISVPKIVVRGNLTIIQYNKLKEHLPKKIFRKLIKNIINWRSLGNGVSGLLISHLIDHCMSWEDTPEGFNYWSTMKYKYIKRHL